MSSWRGCSRCKKPIGFGAEYLVCSVSTCNRARSAMVFCSMDCWDAHVPIAGHREAHAEERRAPSSAEEAAAKPVRVAGQSRPRTGKRRVAPVKRRDPSLPKETLVVVKALKTYIKAAGDLRTSDGVADVLSEKLRDICDRAIDRAKADGRKTVLDRDFF